MRLDYVSNEDDWVILFINGEFIFCGHSVPTSTWLSLLLDSITCIKEWYVDFEEHGSDLMMDEVIKYGRQIV